VKTSDNITDGTMHLKSENNLYVLYIAAIEEYLLNAPD